jgi:hypothetical protein
LLGQVGCANGKCCSSDDRKTDWDTDDEKDKGIREEVDRAVLGGSDIEVAEETSDPGHEDEENDQDEQSGTDGVHDGLEMTRVGGALDERSGLSDKGATGGFSNDRVGFSTLATGSVVANIAHVLVNGQGLSGDGRLISGNDRNTNVVFLVII